MDRMDRWLSQRRGSFKIDPSVRIFQAGEETRDFYRSIIHPSRRDRGSMDDFRFDPIRNRLTEMRGKEGEGKIFESISPRNRAKITYNFNQG